MRRRAVEIEVVFLRVLAMAAFVSGETEDPFLQNWITFVPQCEGKANHLSAITDSGQAVFVPAIGARTGMVVWQVFPCIPVRAVVFTHCAPCTFAEVGPPALPMLVARARFGQSNFLFCHDSFRVSNRA